MAPVIFTIGKISISSFGFLLALGFLFGTFLIWRLARAWDLDEEKILDLIVLTFLGGLIAARIYFILQNFSFFALDFFKMILLTKYPGLSFWGGFLGGWLALYLFTSRFKLNFFAIADMATIGFLSGLIFGNLGCLLGGCSNGVVSNLFFAVSIVGVVGKRFPIQALEATVYALVLIKLWPQAIRFHTPGKVLSVGLVYIGIIKFVTEFLKDAHSGGYFLSLALIVLGTAIFYRISKRSLLLDLKSFILSPSFRKDILDKLLKSLYNLVAVPKLFLYWLTRVKFSKIVKRINVKSTPKNFKSY